MGLWIFITNQFAFNQMGGSQSAWFYVVVLIYPAFRWWFRSHKEAK